MGGQKGGQHRDGTLEAGEGRTAGRRNGAALVVHRRISAGVRTARRPASAAVRATAHGRDGLRTLTRSSGAVKDLAMAPDSAPAPKRTKARGTSASSAMGRCVDR